jgi:hypothetical protein
MLKIRPEQLAALRPARRRSSAELAAALRDLGHTDEELGTLTAFVERKRAEAAGHGIGHEYLVLQYAAFSFRYGGDWAARAPVAAILSERLPEEEKMQRLADRLRDDSLAG